MVTPALFPSASKGSATHIIDNVGHLIFAHNREASADAFSRIMEFLANNALAAQIGKPWLLHGIGAR